ncbi:MAG: phenylalanine--tRNA ligase subunit beta [Acidobacteria bacterium]|nr:MAG: phenylalanine--tRNA ligase subunit beta [Acidobacteriota bacterium]
MPVVGLAVEDLFAALGRPMSPERLEEELHRFGCSVEGWAEIERHRCLRCGALTDSPKGEGPSPSCDGCGADLRAGGAEPAGTGRVLKMELLAVRPDLFDVPGLARALRGFLGYEEGAPRYAVGEGPFSVTVDPALNGPEVRRPRIAAAVVRGLSLDDARLRSLMKLQENVHWALGRDRKLASIGVYDLDRVAGTELRYRAVPREGVRFVPLGAEPREAMTPARILEIHPKGRAFARLLDGCPLVPLLEDARGNVLSMPPIINSEETRVTTSTRHVLIDVTGHEDRQIDKALNIVVTSLLESCPEARAETVTVRYPGGSRVTPDLAPQELTVDVAESSRLIGVGWDARELAGLLRRMRHDAEPKGEGAVAVRVPAWRADVMHPRDLVEDAAIAFGYDRLPEAGLASATIAAPHPRQQFADRVREVLAGCGCLEVVTLALGNEERTYEWCGLPPRPHVRLDNPISVEQTMLRVSLLPGLLETLAVNLGHPYPQAIFEVGSITERDAEAETGARERLHAAVALAGDGVGYADIRALADTLLDELAVPAGDRSYEPSDAALFLAGRGARLGVRGAGERGLLGEVHPAVLERYRIVHPVAVMELDLEPFAADGAGPRRNDAGGPGR